MKKNHEGLAALIQKAINLCSYDDVLQDAKRHLREALVVVGRVSNKRTKRDQQYKMYEEQAKKKNDEWWKTIKDNIHKLNDTPEDNEPSKDE